MVTLLKVLNNLSDSKSVGALHFKSELKNMFNPDYLLKNDLVFIGSQKTIAEKPLKAASEGVFNNFMEESNFADLPDDDLMRSIRLFGEKVIPEIRAFQPY